MRFAMTDEQRLLQASVRDWLADHYDFRARQAGVHGDGGSAAVWSAFAEMGWLALPLSEDDGGFGGGALESGWVMQAFGRHLVVEPFHACVLQAARLLSLAGTPQQKSGLLPAVIEGRLRLALAHAEAGDGLPWSARRTLAHRVGEGWRIAGDKLCVAGAAGAARWLVTARDAADASTRVFLIDPLQAGVACEAYDTADGQRAADLRLDVHVGADDALGGPDAAVEPLLQQVLAEGVLAHAWQATGALQAVLEQTTQYTQQRQQFGQPLSAFQVVQHRLAEMAVQAVEAQAACELAAMRLAHARAAACDAASMARNKVARAARYVAQEAVQLHGAMGVCEELPVAATFRRLLAFAQIDGDAAVHARQRGTTLLASGDHARSQALEACA